MTAGNAYRITLTYNGKKCSFTFNDNIYNESDKSDFLYCLYLDAMAYDTCPDAYSFARTYGYEDNALEIYKACEMQSKRLHRLFNDEEVELLATLE